MNSYIIRPLAQIKKKLSSKETLSPDTIDSIIGELEMIKLNIEQHITNMPENREQNNILSAAHNAVQNLTEILDSFAGMECPRKIAVTCKPLFHQGRGVSSRCI